MTRALKTPKIHLKPQARNQGFALIITVSMLALIAVIAVGLLSLSSVALRSASTNESRQVARSNARLAMLLALSRLQELAGPDTRVTAPASAVAQVNGRQQLCGVWRSWEGDDHDSSGMPVAPNYGAKLVDATDSGSGSGKFLGWLVSGDAGSNDVRSPATLAEGSSTVPLLSDGTLGSSADSTDEVHLTPTMVTNGSGSAGSYAWWIEGENTKARLKPVEEADDTFEATEQMLVSPGPNGSEFNIGDTSDADLAITRPSLDFIADDESVRPAEFFHDLTVTSRGLLTNTANGGWRRDLSLLSENWSSVSDGFSAFTRSPGEVIESGKSFSGGSSDPLIYPWSTGQKFGDSVSWSALVDFATQYKQLKTVRNVSASEVGEVYEVTNTDQADWVDIVQRIPVIARIHLVVSLSSTADTSNSGKYFPAIILNPVVTMWNPYSVALDLSSYQNYFVSFNDSCCPLNFTFKVDSSTSTYDLAKITTKNSGNQDNITGKIQANSPTTWLPGEVRVFSAAGSTTADTSKGTTVTFQAGYRPDSGLRYELPNFSSQTGDTEFSVTQAVNSATFSGPNVNGTGFYFTHNRGTKQTLPRTTNVQCMLDLDDAQKMLGEEVALNEMTNPPTLAELARSPQPIVSIISSMRFGRDTNDTYGDVVTNGIHNMNPIVGYMTDGPDGSVAGGRFDAFPYNVQFFAVNSVADPGMPSGIDDDLEGYVGSGFGSGDGLSNLILLEIPTRPLRSIGDLQHFNVNACNAKAPFTLNAFGNSRAAPFIEKDEIKMASGTGHDHSYAINHVLADDWFVSSITPDPRDWSSSLSRSLSQVYEDHLSGDQALPNHYYVPAPDAEDASTFLSDRDAWQKVAAELEVEGMFNINSTSELAWSMLLKRNFGSDAAADDPGVLTLNDSTPGNTRASVSLESDDGGAFPRSVLTSDSAAGPGGFSLLSQPIRFSDDEITALAKEIVTEIKQRGPFLSLSEFFNRQLSSDTDLAHAGAVEAALLRMSEGGSSENPYRDLQSVFADDASSQDVLGNALSYPFAKAAEGSAAYGFPGWTRQADVLRPISGILSARDDTFTIRAYGDARDPSSNEVISRAWCEAVVQRKAGYVDSSSDTGDDKYTLPSESTLKSGVNHVFGRQFVITQFRWLSAEEV